MIAESGLKPPCVLVLGTSTRVLLAIARSLGRRGIRVEVGWCPVNSFIRHSKYISLFHDVPPYHPQKDDWKRALHDLLSERRYRLVVPSDDSSAVPLQALHADFEESPSALYVLAQPTFEIVCDKVKSYQLASKLDIPIPRGRLVREPVDADALCRDFGLPLVIKPRETFPAASSGGWNVVSKAHTVQQAARLLGDPQHADGVLVQENQPGRGVGIELLACHGDVLVAFQHVRLHETTEWGSSYRKSAPLNAALLDAARRLMKALEYTGVAMVEFIEDEQSGRWTFLEINGRFWGSLPLAVAAGADFPYYLYQLLVDGVRVFPQEYQSEVYCRNLALDIQSFSSRAKRSGNSRLRQVMEMLGDVWTTLSMHDCIDSFAWDDPKPFWRELTGLARRACTRCLTKVRLGPRR